MRLKEKLEYFLGSYNLCPKSSLSQNFLIDPKMVARIVDEIGPKKDEVVVEIGAGTGILTSHLVNKTGKVLAIEIDEGLCRIIRHQLGGEERLEIVCQDVTRVNLDSLIPKENKVKVVGNLPYHIASWLILHLTEKRWWEVMVFTIQREVAQRLLAPPRDKARGALTVIVSYYADIERLIDIPPQAFYPAPKVSSTVVRIKPANREVVAKDEKFFKNLVKAGFSFRRKTLSNSLAKELGIAKQRMKQTLAEANIPEKARAEELEVEDFIKLSNILLLLCGGKSAR